MTPWLRKSLVIWFAGSALAVVGGSQLPQFVGRAWAQPRTKDPQTPEELARAFRRFISAFDGTVGGRRYRLATNTYLSEEDFSNHLISANDKKVLGSGGIIAVLLEMAELWMVQEFPVEKRNSPVADRATVDVKPGLAQWQIRPI